MFYLNCFNITDHSSFLETSNKSTPYNSDEDDLQDISTGDQVRGRNIREANNDDEYEEENSGQLLNIDLQSDEIHEVTDMTDLVRGAAGRIVKLEKPNDLECNEISELLKKLTGSVDNEAQSQSSSVPPDKSNLPYRVIPIRHISSKTVTSSEAHAVHGAIKSPNANNDEGNGENELSPNSKVTITALPRTAKSPVHSNFKEITCIIETDKQQKPISLITKPKEIIIPRFVHKSDNSNKHIQPGSILVLNDKANATSRGKDSTTQLGLSGDASADLESSSTSSSSGIIHRSILESIENESDSESESESDLISGTCTSISTQTPIIDKKDSTLFLHDKNRSSVMKTKTISVNVQKPGEELQMKDGAVTAEAQKQEFIIVHLPEGTTIKNYKVQSRSKLEVCTVDSC